MSKFNITNINYISSGPKGTVVNVDFEREPIIRKQHILSEETNISAIEHESEDKVISVSHSNDTKKIIDQIKRLNNERIYKNKTLVVEIQDKETQNTIHEIRASISQVDILPLYDIKDLNIKYNYPKKSPDYTKNKYTTDGKINLYSADMTDDPIGFIHYPENGNSILLTESSKNEMKSENTTLIDNVINKKPSTFYSHRIDQITDNKKYQYSTLSELSVENYSEYLKTHSSLELFEPKYELHNIKNNFIYQIDNNCRENEYHKYENGDIYGNTFRTVKNTLNSLYSMDMTDSNTIQNCREYCGIGICGEFAFLKFYDNIVYTNNSNNTQRDKQMNSNESGKRYPYQKVEILSQLNTSIVEAKHKANVFSVVLKNTKLNNTSKEDRSNELRQKIMKDITNFITDIAKKVCPANTHLFNVEFLD